jgi:hypothetical protein
VAEKEKIIFLNQMQLPNFIVTAWRSKRWAPANQ